MQTTSNGGLQSDVLKHGRIYVDVPFDEADFAYQKLAGHLENPDGSLKIEDVAFYYMTLAQAMEFAYKDAPGYWEKYWGSLMSVFDQGHICQTAAIHTNDSGPADIRLDCSVMPECSNVIINKKKGNV